MRKPETQKKPFAHFVAEGAELALEPMSVGFWVFCPLILHPIQSYPELVWINIVRENFNDDEGLELDVRAEENLDGQRRRVSFWMWETIWKVMCHGKPAPGRGPGT